MTLETRDACDGQLRPGATEAALAAADAGVIHPLTGPVAIKGAEPGDLLEVEFVSIEPQPYPFSAIVPGLGFLRDAFTEPFLAHWNIAVGYATSPQVPGASFMGVSGVAPSLRQLAEWTRREAALAEWGGLVFPPDASGAAPATGAGAVAGVRTLPPRENGGNIDVKQLSAGAKLLLPVAVAGALFATGDGHFAQGDGEVCVTAMEMGATGTTRFRLWKGEARRHNIRWPRFRREDYYIAPEWAAPRRFIATMEMPVTEAGENRGEDLNPERRNALLNMIDLLQERGYTRNQAYVICSVAVDLKVSNVVDVPNYVLSEFLPEALFDE